MPVWACAGAGVCWCGCWGRGGKVALCGSRAGARCGEVEADCTCKHHSSQCCAGVSHACSCHSGRRMLMPWLSTCTHG
jgi:hypothetical protein